jgi:outer membrane protein insertion porin family
MPSLGVAGAVRMAARAVFLTAVLLTGAATLAPPASAQQAPGLAAVERILVSGNRRIEQATIETYLTFKPGDPVTEAALNESIRRLFETGLFANVSIEPQGGTILVRVIENPSINQIAFEGNSTLEDEELRPAIRSRPRTPFTRSRAEQDAQTLVEIYRRLGRYGAEINPVVIEQPDNRVDLVFEISEGPLTGVKSINFVGNETYSNRRLRNVIETSESDLLSQFRTADNYDPDRVELDKDLLRQFYLARGYADFTVLSTVAELSPDREGFFITFTLSEGPIYTFGDAQIISNTPGLQPEMFTDLVEVEPGEDYDNRAIERTIDAIRLRAGEEGFAFIDVRSQIDRDRENQVIAVAFEISEGPRVFLERIEIEGNTRTLDRVIRRQFDIAEGDAFDSRKIADARDKIRALRYFKSVDVTTEPGSSEDRAVVRVTVEEQPTGNLSVGVGFSTDTGPVGNLEVTERNVLGRGQTLSVNVQVSGDENEFSFRFVEPAFLDRDFSVGLQASFEDIDLQDESSYELQRLQFRPTFGFPLDPNTRASVFYEVSNADLRDVPNNASLAVQADEGQQLTSLIGYTLTHDQRNSRVEPTDGYIASLTNEFAGLGGDTQFTRVIGRAKGYKSFYNEDLVVSLELEGGAIFGFGQDIRIDDRFQLGGQSLRGFAQSGVGPRDLSVVAPNATTSNRDALGGKYYVVARTEALFPLGLPDDWGISGGVFADVGALWGLDGSDVALTGVDDGFSLRAATGVSLFWRSGFGPLRVDLGFPVLKEDFDDEEIFRLSAQTRF